VQADDEPAAVSRHRRSRPIGGRRRRWARRPRKAHHPTHQGQLEQRPARHPQATTDANHRHPRPPTRCVVFHGEPVGERAADTQHTGGLLDRQQRFRWHPALGRSVHRVDHEPTTSRITTAIGPSIAPTTPNLAKLGPLGGPEITTAHPTTHSTGQDAWVVARGSAPGAYPRTVSATSPGVASHGIAPDEPQLHGALESDRLGASQAVPQQIGSPVRKRHWKPGLTHVRT
jgi:hypothetical protein